MTELISIPFSAQGNPVLWFMYTLIGLYLLAPIISRWLERASQKEEEFYLGLWGISLYYPILSSWLSINQGNTGILYYFTGYAGYFILGHYLKKYPERISFKCVIPWMGISILAPIICKIAHIQVNFYEVFWYLSIFVVIQCIFWFQTISKMKLHFNAWLERIFTKIANLSFGIYLFHIFIMRYVLWECDFIQNMDSYIVQTITIAIITFVLSTASCYLISLLPFAASIIGYKEKKA
jgi:surface polysaccharide O-acyltransferase-like enzyme